MDFYQVVVIGAGPAGGQCARELSRVGIKVLLVERTDNFSLRNFSSAAGPLEVLEIFDLPESIVGSYWRKIKIFSTGEQQVWETAGRAGVVLEFKALRSFLVQETFRYGGTVRIGTAYCGYERKGGRMVVWLRRNGASSHEGVLAEVLVDATGSERRVLANGETKKQDVVKGIGIEYLIEVDPPVYQDNADTLAFFIGPKWMPQGYAWIFPMEPNRLKVGVGRNFPEHNFVPHQKSYRFYLDQLIEERLQTRSWRVLDIHGKTLSYTRGRRDPHRNGNILAIGDAVSMLNPLTFEGIRHGMMSGRIAARHIVRFLAGDRASLRRYRTSVRRYCGNGWRVSELLMAQLYREPSAEKVDLMLRSLKGFTFRELFDLTFEYRLSRAVKYYTNYSLHRAGHLLRRVGRLLSRTRLFG